MDTKLTRVNLEYVDEIAEGDKDFKKELIKIFVNQIPDFIFNINKYLSEQNHLELAKEAHTAKSSVLIFQMQNAGKLLEKIQILAEKKEFNPIPELMESIIIEMENAKDELHDILNDF